MENKNKKVNESEIKNLISKLESDNGSERQQAREELVKIGKDSIDYLLSLVTHHKHIYRWEAVKTLAEIGDPVAIPLLIQSLEDDVVGVRWIAAEGLIKLGRHSVKPLLEILTKKSDSVFILEGVHHVFYDLREKNELPKGFPIEKLLSALKNSEWAASAIPLVIELLKQN